MIVEVRATYKSGLTRNYYVHEAVPVIELVKLITLPGEKVKDLELRDGEGKPYQYQDSQGG